MGLSASERRSEILQKLNHLPTVRVSELRRTFDVSEVSIRRDLEHLEGLGLLKRIHGGAAQARGSVASSPLAQRMDEHRHQKERIGRAGAAMIRRNDRIILDSGTTPLQVARFIPNNLLTSGNLTIISQFLPLVREIGHYPGVNLILVGGIYMPEYELVAGPMAIQNLKGLHVDKIFVGTDGITFSQGITTANILEAELARTMVRSSSEVIVVSDSSKIGVKGLVSISPISEIHMLITDQDAPADFVDELRRNGVEVILV